MNKIRILVVDDEENIRLLFKEELEEENYEVEVASNGYEALEKFKTSAFDLIVMDIKMPGMDGIQALNEIKNINKDQPVILCSAYGEYKQNFSSWVSDGYIVKSADTDELKQTIRNVLHLQ
ncbi:MAG TPA: response regulator [Syntrophorhabdaceae bacterium]|nr:response regulator [Syntrophorhabdaceae bacterium]